MLSVMLVLHRVNYTCIFFYFSKFHHLLYIWNTFWATPGFFHKFSVLFKGPGWGPGKPRLGLSEEIPEVSRGHGRGCGGARYAASLHVCCLRVIL